MRITPCLIASLLLAVSAEALPTVVPDPVPCVRDLEMTFFPEYIVSQGLSMYGIRQEIWQPINLSLQQKSPSVPDRMKIKTAYMVPNPIEYPMQNGPTAKILKQVLLEVFLESMREFYVNDQPRANMIFDYIFSRQLPRFVRCFGEEANELAPTSD